MLFGQIFAVYCENLIEYTTILTPWNRVLLVQLTVLSQTINSPYFMLCSLLHSKPATCPFPEPDQISPRPPIFYIHYNRPIPSMPSSSKCPLSLRFLRQNPVYISNLQHTWHVISFQIYFLWASGLRQFCICHQPHACYVPLILIFLEPKTPITCGKSHKFCSLSVCSFPQFPPIASILGPHFFVNIVYLHFVTNFKQDYLTLFIISFLVAPFYGWNPSSVETGF